MIPSLFIGPRTLLNDSDHCATAMFWRSAITESNSVGTNVSVLPNQSLLHANKRRGHPEHPDFYCESGASSNPVDSTKNHNPTFRSE